jgi:hypothetical protein
MGKQYIELTQLTKEMYETVQEMKKKRMEIVNLAKRKAMMERQYRKALAAEIVKLRDKGIPATLISDLARGNVADLKFQRDIAADLYRSELASLEVIRSEGNILQTISKYQDEV